MKNNFWRNGKFLFSRRQNNILSAAIVLMIMILAAAFLGLIRDRLLAGIFFNQGRQWQLDIYFAAFRIPDMLFQILVLGTLSASFIPVFSEYLVKDEKEANQLACIVVNIGLVIYLIIAALLFIFAKPLGSLITQNLAPDQLNLMVNLMRILLVSESILAISNFFTAMLQVKQRFLLPAISAVLYNLGIILGIFFLSPVVGIYGPVIGVGIGSILQTIIQYPLVKRLGFNYHWTFNFHHSGLQKIAHLMLPRTLSFALDQIALSVTVYIATSLAAGSLAIYNFAQHLSGLPVSMFGLTIGQAALPSLSKAIHQDKKNFTDILISSVQQIFYLALPVSIILLVLRVPAVRLAFGAKTFPWQATLLTGQVVGILSLSLFAQSLAELLVRAYYALQDTKTVLFLKSLAMILGTGLSFLFVYGFNWGLLGLAAATSFNSLIYIVLLFVFMNKKIGSLWQKKFTRSCLKIIGATALAGLALWLPMRFLDRFILDTTRTINLIILTIITITLSSLVYLVFSYLLKIEQLQSILAVLKRFGQWRQILSQTEEILDDK